MSAVPDPLPTQISAPARRALLNLLAGRSTDAGLHGRSAFGGHVSVIRSLRRMGLVTTDHERGIELTALGRATAARCVDPDGEARDA